MRTRALFFLAVLGCATLGHSQDIYARYNGSCQQGGQRVTVNGIQSNAYWQQSYPGCTVTVYSHGSLTLASLFADGAGTVPLSNPFSSSSTGTAAWYAANGSYDVQYSGNGILTPFTLPAVQLCLACTGGGGGGGISGSGTVPFIPIWTGTAMLGNSLASDDGTSMLYGGSVLGFSTTSAGTSVQFNTNQSIRQTLQVNASGAAIVNSGNGTTGVNGSGISLNAGNATDSTGGLIQFNAGNSSTGPGGAIYLHAGGALANGQPAGNILLGAGQGTTVAGNGTVQIGVGTGSTANPFYEGTTTFANLGSLAPSTFSLNTVASAIWCSDCRGAADGATTGSIALGSGTGTDVMNDGTNWRVRLGVTGGGGGGSPGSPTGSLQWNSSGAFAGSYGTNWTNGGTSNTFGQLNVANLEYIKYADQFNWSQALAAGVTIGSNTITLTPCPNGLTGTNATPDKLHYVYLAGGTPEAVPITGGTCTSGATSGTIIFTAANTHAISTTIQSASGGIKEASVAAAFTVTNPTGSVQSGKVIVPPGYQAQVYGPIYITAAAQTIDFSGSILECYVSALSCLINGDATTTSLNYSDQIMINPRMRAMVPSTGAAIEDNAQHTTYYNITTRNKQTGAYFSPYFIKFDDDQAAVINGMDTSLGTWEPPCSAASCGTTIGAPAGAGESTVLTIKDWNGSLNCLSNGLWYHQSNTVFVRDSIIQGYPEFGVSAVGGFTVTPNFTGENMYEEVGTCSNPLYPGISAGVTGAMGIGAESGIVSLYAQQGPSGKMPVFAVSSAGTTVTDVFVVGHSSIDNATTPMRAGQCKTTNTGTCTVIFPQFGAGAGTMTFDVIGTNQVTADTPVIPVGTGNFAYSTANTVSACTNASNFPVDTCTVTITMGSPTSYTTPPIQYFPKLDFWPGFTILSASSDTQLITGPAQFIGNNVLTGSSLSVLGTLYPSFHLTGAAFPPAGVGNGTWIQNMGLDPTSINNDYGALLLAQSGHNAVGPQTGVLGFPVGGQQGSIATELITLAYGDKGLAAMNSGQRGPMNANDSAIGWDQAGTGSPTTAFQLAFQSPVSTSRYIGHVFDNTSWLERLTSTTDTFKVPLTFSGTAFAFNSPEVSAPSSPAAGTQSCYASAGNGLACKNSAGTVFTMTAPGSGANYQTFLNAGSALPVEPAANFIITGGSCVDNPGSTRTDCTFPGGATVSSFSAGNLSPLFTTSVATSTTTPALTFSLTNAGGGTVFGRSAGTSGAPAYTITPVLGIPTSSQGTLGLAGATSGTATLTALAAAGTPTITFGSTSGTVAVTATSPILLNATTGNLTGPTIVTATGLTNQRIPKSTGAQAIVDGCLTDNGTQVANTCTGGFQAGPASSANMLMTGTASNTDAAGELTLSGGAASYTFIGTYVSRPECFFRDITTPANAVTTQTVTTTTITLAGTGTDVIGYMCIGRN